MRCTHRPEERPKKITSNEMFELDQMLSSLLEVSRKSHAGKRVIGEQPARGVHDAGSWREAHSKNHVLKAEATPSHSISR